MRTLTSLLAVALSMASASVYAQTPPPPSPRSADGYVTARRLGGTTSFHHPALTDPASVKKMATSKDMESDIRKVLADAGIPQTADAVVAMLSGASTSPAAGACSNARPVDGVMVECDFATGATLEWMAYRPNMSRRNRAPGRLEKVRWGGRAPFKAFLFRVTNADRIYTFVVPKACGNLSLMSVQDVPRTTEPAPPPVVAPGPPPPAPAPTPAPQPAAPAPAAPAPVIAPPAQPAPVHGNPFFVDALFGKDRRVRAIGDRTTNDGSAIIANAGAGQFAQCSPIVGAKLGIAKRFDNDWELAGAAGVAFSLVSADHKVTEHEVLVDVEVNKYLNSGVFLGTGLSLWDITHSDTFAPALMLHFGVPLGNHPTHPLYFLVESRMFLDSADDIPNNYQFWGGLRLNF